MFDAAAQAFDRRLDRKTRSPIAVAVSGGADSLAALIAACDWARRHGRPVLALSVDHGLQPGSAGWSAFAGEAAARLGAEFIKLDWMGAKPLFGLPAAARSARHRLLAEAARSAGAEVIVIGHTLGDARENALMGQGPLAEWSPSPVWPEGRGVFLLRPLLGVSRGEVRTTLAGMGEGWIDDPANDDVRHARVRARLSSEAFGDVQVSTPQADAADLARSVLIEDGAFHINRGLFRAADPAAARKVMAAALTCAGGGERPPRGARLDALYQRLIGSAPVVATLAGAKLLADDAILIVREAGEAARGGLAERALSPGVPAVWDGRYLLTAGDPGLTVGAMAGRMAGLGPQQKALLAKVPAPARPGLPLVVGARSGGVVSGWSLMAPRFLAACDVISQESEIGIGGAAPVSVLCKDILFQRDVCDELA